MHYNIPKLNKSNVGPYVRYAVDFWNSDYRLTQYGISRVWELLLEYIFAMKEQEFRGLAPSYVEFSIHNRYADEFIVRLNRLVHDPCVIERLPIIEPEIGAYLDLIVLREKQRVEVSRRASAFPKMPYEGEQSRNSRYQVMS